MISRIVSSTRRRWGTEMIAVGAVFLLTGCTGLSRAEKDSIRASVTAVLGGERLATIRTTTRGTCSSECPGRCSGKSAYRNW